MMTVMTRVTRMTGMTRVTRVTGMTRVTRMTGMTRVTRKTGMTKVTGITGIAAKQALYEPNKANAAFYVKCETREMKCLLPVHCSGFSHVHYMNVAFELVN